MQLSGVPRHDADYLGNQTYDTIAVTAQPAAQMAFSRAEMRDEEGEQPEQHHSTGMHHVT
jgi:hypothetical protein